MAAYVAQGQVREYTQYNFTEDFHASLDTLKAWIGRRIAWMDANMPGNCTVGISDASPPEKKFTVYPNPSRGEFRIQNDELRIESIDIYDVLGENILHRNSNSKQATIKLSVPSGVYFLKVKSSGRIFSSKIIITEFQEN